MTAQAAPIDQLRVPPHDLGAEQAVLGALMLATDAIMQIQDWLPVEAFYTRRHQLIYRAIRELDQRKQPCDAITLSDWFQNSGLDEMIGETGYLIDLAANTPSAANIVAYAEIVAEQAKRRQAITIGTDLAEGAWAPGASSAEVIALASDGLAKLQQSTLRRGPVPAKKALDKYFKTVMRRYEQKTSLIGIPTPWPAVDKALSGWQNETFYILAGRPGMGKSVMGFQAAVDAALRGYPTVLFSVEMSEEQVMARVIACYGQIPYRWVLNPVDCPDSEVYWSRMTNIIAQVKDAPLWIDDTPALTCEEWLARSRRLHKQVGLKFMVLDHLHHMSINPENQVRHELGRIGLTGKNISREMHIPVLALAQINRLNTQRADKRPSMSDLRESGELEQIADVIAMPHRDDYYDKNSNAKGLIEFLLVKGRDVDTSELIYLWNRFDQMRVENYDGMPPEAPAPHAPSGWGARTSRISN